MRKALQDQSDKLNVLIIEDNLGDFVLIEDYLLDKFKNIEIAHYYDYNSGIEYLQNHTEDISIILLDLNLPDKNGIDLINGILSHNFEIPIIILTGYTDLNMAQQSLKIGIYDYLVKDEINPVILHKTIIFSLNRSSFIRQIEHEKQNYENLFNFNPQPTWLIDSNTFQIINANIAAQIKYGKSEFDFLKMSFLQLHPIEEEELIKQTLTIKKKATTTNHFTHILNDGMEIKVDVYFREINSNGNSRLIVQTNDISETLRHINLLEDQKENKDELHFWMEQLKISTMEMDDIVKKIVSDSNQLEQD